MGWIKLLDIQMQNWSHCLLGWVFQLEYSPCVHKDGYRPESVDYSKLLVELSIAFPFDYNKLS